MIPIGHHFELEQRVKADLRHAFIRDPNRSPEDVAQSVLDDLPDHEYHDLLEGYVLTLAEFECEEAKDTKRAKQLRRNQSEARLW